MRFKVPELVLKQGEPKIIELTLKRRDGEAADLTGVSQVDFKLAPMRYGTVQALFMKTLGGGVSIVSPPTAGVLRIRIEGGDTESLPGGIYRHETEVHDADGDKATVRYPDQDRFWGTLQIETDHIVAPGSP